VDELLAALRAVAEPTRLRIIALCLKGELTVSELVRITGQSQPRISRHLKLLTDAGLLERSREGTWVFYRMAQDGIGAPLAQHLSILLPDGDEILTRDRDRLAEVKRDRAEAAATYFRNNAAEWDHLRSLHVDQAVVEQVIRNLLPADKNASLLDIGTGTGHLLELLGPELGPCQGVDLSHEMLSVARANLDRAAAVNCRVRQADLRQLPFAASTFDIAAIHQVLHYVDDQALAISEAARVLKPGGKLLVVDLAPHKHEALRDEHKHRRLGFPDEEAAGWFIHAHLELKETVHLAGDPLTVSIWLAEKPEQLETGSATTGAQAAALH